MPRIHPVDPRSATGKAREQLDAIEARLGGVPNLMKTFAHSPAVQEFHEVASKALAHGVIPAKVREQVNLVVSQINGCDYCLAAHTQLARGQRLTDEQIIGARRGQSEDPHTAAILAFASAVLERRGHLDDADFDAARSAGVTDAELAEVFALVALRTFTNHFAIAAQVDVDFPAAPALA